MNNLRKGCYTCQTNMIFISVTYFSKIENQKVLSVKKAQFAKEPVGSSLGLIFFFFQYMGLKKVAMLLQSNHLMPEAVGQPQQHPPPPEFCHSQEGATVFQLTHDIGSSYQFRVLSALGEHFSRLSSSSPTPSWCLHVDCLVQSSYILQLNCRF